MARQVANREQAALAEIGDAGLEVQERTDRADVDQVRTVAEVAEQPRELRGARLVSAGGEADEEMPVGVADVAGIDRAGSVDACELGEGGP